MNPPVARLRAAHAHDGGFTVTELAVVICVLLLLSGSATGFLVSSWRHSSDLAHEADLQTEARLALGTLVSELRQATSGDPATAAFVTVGTAGLSFYTPDRSSPYHLRLVTYRLQAGQLQRSVAVSTNTGGPPWTFGAVGGYAAVAHGVVNTSLFATFDDTGAPTTTPAAVHRVDISLVVDANGAAAPAAQTFQTSVELRSTR